MACAATNPNLNAIFESHPEETCGQIQRIDQVVESCGIKLMRIKRAAMEGRRRKGGRSETHQARR
jgi:ferritin-like metal-binding protein YciE